MYLPLKARSNSYSSKIILNINKNYNKLISDSNCIYPFLIAKRFCLLILFHTSRNILDHITIKIVNINLKVLLVLLVNTFNDYKKFTIE